MQFSFSMLLTSKEYNGESVRYIQEKKDGIRLAVFKTNEYTAVMSRSAKSDWWPEIQQGHETLRKLICLLPVGTVMDCEAWAPGVPSTQVKTLLITGDTRLQLTPFALPFYDNIDHRQMPLGIITNQLKHLGFVPSPIWSLDEFAPVDPWLYVERAKMHKIEGYMAKVDHYEGWYKIKPVRTVDCIVTNYTVSNSYSYGGGLKAICVSLWEDGKLNHIASVGSGFDLVYRTTVKPDALIGRVCEVAYDSVAGQGRLRHPRFLKWRDDKTSSECTMDQIKPKETA